MSKKKSVSAEGRPIAVSAAKNPDNDGGIPTPHHPAESILLFSYEQKVSAIRSSV
jgi:hypothetical protein